MAVHPTLNASPAPGSTATTSNALTPQQVYAISSWSEQAIESLSLESSPIPYRNSAPLTIPLDDDVPQPATPTPVRLRRSVRVAEDTTGTGAATAAGPSTYRRREPLRRDSLKRRESLLKGKEGSRRRQRWENGTLYLHFSSRYSNWVGGMTDLFDLLIDRLLSNPWAQPPSANDWEIQPTYPRHNPVPYYLASLWDSHQAAKEQARRKSKREQGISEKKKKKKQTHGDAKASHPNAELDKISKELRAKLKHARAARGLVQELEEEIRLFVQEWIETQTWHQTREPESECCSDNSSSDDDEVVFAGRKVNPSSRKQRRSSRAVSGEKMVFESPAEDRAAGFGRWLVHSLASYYGLRTWSVTVGNPPRREAYVGIDEVSQGLLAAAGRGFPGSKPDGILPRPLWVSM
ncbi:conserved hypothetical protein [Trichophyton verrucosum HKI 0517]|uniref:R3H-associated N-terminal domain-containing protein n=1 Tax=Trichophyton verrucosum (strain HKI 0517) TaxID=663202 RepID=D4DHE2_TRIVH|nr:uncharacterized protein TRV_06598 [Trichophyton verrucosum HKI 0517]EFE38724.1 conserved hypothetical protein [Trichophyton verrucosum HKI 0517]